MKGSTPLAACTPFGNTVRLAASGPLMFMAGDSATTAVGLT
jgi:hypothetical protein